jgi:hypothetical protein
LFLRRRRGSEGCCIVLLLDSWCTEDFHGKEGVGGAIRQR